MLFEVGDKSPGKLPNSMKVLFNVSIFVISLQYKWDAVRSLISRKRTQLNVQSEEM
ncbi:hypothetical protein TRIATDRAFT_298023 [Trichoderma atroviride IMI 206040]|uniref:Uncharacterized protein n=1 Tax=Hypocrea atroviridis (strain ATCC 20476 / IMI 206040) TaxID=452589 RepID=G9NL04_HYPAI|nr:uncharacterized protein TRIATDRAFT_298023 [Trichoderma atroviride IMI 206040]EHK48572.1 hypothetical protein TRIATDRAFT_298023 [Trichoderma atroviride IMI 206040]